MLGKPKSAPWRQRGSPRLALPHARQVSERGHARMTEVERETSRDVKQRVAEAQKAADEFVRRERQAAEADAAEDRQEVQDEVDEEIEEAQR